LAIAARRMQRKWHGEVAGRHVADKFRLAHEIDDGLPGVCRGVYAEVRFGRIIAPDDPVFVVEQDDPVGQGAARLAGARQRAREAAPLTDFSAPALVELGEYFAPDAAAFGHRLGGRSRYPLLQPTKIARVMDRDSDEAKSK